MKLHNSLTAALVAAASFGCLAAPCFAQGQQIQKVSISGNFFNAAGDAYDGSTLIDLGGEYPLTVTHGNDSVEIPFTARYLRTDDLGNGYFSDIVEITLRSLAGTGFVGRPGGVIFDGHDAGGNTMPIDRVVSWEPSPNVLWPGWMLWTQTFPAPFVHFTGKDYGVAQGCPDRGIFTLDYMYYVPAPGALILPAGLLLVSRRRSS